jgi:hypothetical protein
MREELTNSELASTRLLQICAISIFASLTFPFISKVDVIADLKENQIYHMDSCISVHCIRKKVLICGTACN